MTLIESALRPSAKSDEPREYDLHLIGGTEWIVSRAGKIDELKGRQTQRVIVANLTLGRLNAIRRSDLADLSGFDECYDGRQLSDALERLRRFGRVRNLHKPPFWAALSISAKRYSLGLQTSGTDALKEICQGFTTTIDTVAEGDEAPRLVCGQLDADDLRLIDLWQQGRLRDQAGERNIRRERLSLLSLGFARLAEKLVLRYLRAQGHSTRDVSILQLSGRESLWKTCDVQTDRHFDVKNATTFGSRKRHLFVPKFKKVAGSDVLIAGVISSPFSEFVENRRRKKKFMGGRFVQYVRQTFLGFAALDKLAEIQSAINSLPERQQELELSFYENALPAWAFEASDGIDLNKLFNVATLLAREPTTIIALSFATRKEIPEFAMAGLNEAQRAVLDQFRAAVEKAGYTKAAIAMFAISEFLAWTMDGRDATGLIRFLRKLNSVEDFAGDRESTWFASRPDRRSEKYEIQIDYRGSACGGLYDPTLSIRGLFDLLEKCAAQIKRLSLRFKHFDVPNAYILVGKDESGRAITLYAYCGGKLDNGAWCNHTPLVIGQNENCPSCHRLVCHECDYCSDNCSARSARKAERKAKNDATKAGWT
ncbi:hypothetical protein EN833_30680 [Mesorhizobium sp. M4B.F.Ca.ET.190.01.1.1]|uniref:hypothetical protein n=1 Tax=unclassified Mesorhizobium TaxID=325217 RepID=UPI0010920E2B|nr:MULTISPECIES: hypothetical protein [unclassified Mesorhizobium]TGR00981.1 hypothetical protein EN843_30675 [Mesorhizobium sp. M4B.F.Ca.ET.200.01.1.1]TGS12699.1 hypothetical protein EN833_30680 [Mesorhizobium sp. M4B.F.Ca.ET.190.01.1.1]TGT25324.1 hypothetical protein EN815_30665 [Mesorhizobium sp. M4B.F.Ca.ET.172.01.1.1]